MLVQPQKQVLLLVLMRKPFVNGAMNFTRAMVILQNQKEASTIVHMFLMKIAKKALFWLHSNAYKKEKPLTADIFAT